MCSWNMFLVLLRNNLSLLNVTSTLKKQKNTNRVMAKCRRIIAKCRRILLVSLLSMRMRILKKKCT